MYECDYCDFESDSERGLKIHTSQVHEGSQKKTYTCEECGDTFVDYPSRREGRGRKSFFCSKECKDEIEKVDKFNVVCSWCSSEFEKYPSTMDEMGEYSIDNHFCDKGCESEYKSEHWVGEDHPSYSGGNEEVVCEECGDTYKVKPSVVDETRFCSRECQTENQKEPTAELECGWCSDRVERKSHNIKGDSVFCSPSCFSMWMSEQREGDGNPQWLGGTQSYRGPNWNRQRRQRLDRDGYECKLCGKSRQENYELHGRDLEVHHKIRFSTFDSYEEANKLDNLVVLCSDCHKDVTHGKYPVPHNDVIAL